MVTIEGIHFRGPRRPRMIRAMGEPPATARDCAMNEAHGHDAAYRITYVTLDELNLRFETQEAVADDTGELVLREAPTLPDERRALRELICQAA